MPAAQESIAVLVIDDDRSFVTFICEALEKLGKGPEVALTGSDALARFRGRHYCGVLLDLGLPDMHGLAVLRQIRTRDASVPIAVLTGAGSVPLAVEAMKLGATDFIEKPIRLVVLTHAVRTLFCRGRSTDPCVTGPDRMVDRLATCMNAVVESPVDVPTVREWAVCVGKSESSLYALCELVGVPAKAALDLARLLRADRCAESGGLRRAFDAADPRTVARLLKRAGLPAHRATTPPVIDMLHNQQLISDSRVLERLAYHLQCHCRTPLGGGV